MTVTNPMIDIKDLLQTSLKSRISPLWIETPTPFRHTLFNLNLMAPKCVIF